MYDSDLTDAQWESIKHFFARQTFRKHTPRELVNALFYLNKTGVQWRYLPKSFPPWQTVYYHFRCWMRRGLWQRPGDALPCASKPDASRVPRRPSSTASR